LIILEQSIKALPVIEERKANPQNLEPLFEMALHPHPGPPSASTFLDMRICPAKLTTQPG
jgi:hypothetical protein